MESAPTIYCDNQGTIRMAKNEISRIKHIDVKYHFIRDVLSRGKIKLMYIPSNENGADILTKCKTLRSIPHFWNKLGLRQSTEKEGVL